MAFAQREAARALLSASQSSYDAALKSYQLGLRNIVDVVTAHAHPRTGTQQRCHRAHPAADAVGEPRVSDRRPAAVGCTKDAPMSKRPAVHLLVAGCGLPASILLLGCRHAPSFNVLGSYFPGWIACILFGILLTAGLHWIFKRLGLERHLPLLPVFYLAIVLSIACTLWLIAFE